MIMSIITTTTITTITTAATTIITPLHARSYAAFSPPFNLLPAAVASKSLSLTCCPPTLQLKFKLNLVFAFGHNLLFRFSATFRSVAWTITCKWKCARARFAPHFNHRIDHTRFNLHIAQPVCLNVAAGTSSSCSTACAPPAVSLASCCWETR